MCTLMNTVYFTSPFQTEPTLDNLTCIATEKHRMLVGCKLHCLSSVKLILDAFI